MAFDTKEKDATGGTGRLTAEEAAGLLDVVALWESQQRRVEEYGRSLIAETPELAPFVGRDDPGAADQSARSRELLRAGGETGDISPYLETVSERARLLSAQGVRFSALVLWFTRLVPLLHRLLVEAHGNDAERLLRALNALNAVVGMAIATVGAEYTELRESLLEHEHRRILRELSVPVIPVWTGVLVVPLVGIVDSTRARQMTEALLESIVQQKAQVAIVDVTGVPTVDTQVADYLIRTVKAARLLGTQSVLVGIRPAIAQTLVHLGVDLGQVQTESDLQSGLMFAFRTLGYHIERESGDA